MSYPQAKLCLPGKKKKTPFIPNGIYLTNEHNAGPPGGKYWSIQWAKLTVFSTGGRTRNSSLYVIVLSGRTRIYPTGEMLVYSLGKASPRLLCGLNLAFWGKPGIHTFYPSGFTYTVRRTPVHPMGKILVYSMCKADSLFDWWKNTQFTTVRQCTRAKHGSAQQTKHWPTLWTKVDLVLLADPDSQTRTQAIKKENHADTHCRLILVLEPKEMLRVRMRNRLSYTPLGCPKIVTKRCRLAARLGAMKARPCSEHKPERDMFSPRHQRGASRVLVTGRLAYPTPLQIEPRRALLSNGSSLSRACPHKINFDNPGSTDKHSVPSDYQNMTKRCLNFNYGSKRFGKITSFLIGQ